FNSPSRTFFNQRFPRKPSRPFFNQRFPSLCAQGRRVLGFSVTDNPWAIKLAICGRGSFLNLLLQL
ncbi:MAG: hypothetical protein RR843_10750, partial [Clostridia bacterium]